MTGQLRYLDPAARASVRELCRYATTGPMARDGGLVPALLDALDAVSPSEPDQKAGDPPEGELRRRLDAVLALKMPQRPADAPGLLDWQMGYVEALVDAKRAARGETGRATPGG